MSEISDRLKELFRDLGLSVADAATRSGIPYRSLVNYTTTSEGARRKPQKPGADALLTMMEAFGVSIDWLLTGKGEKYVKLVTFVPREMTMRDYQELRTRFTNFDDVFKLTQPDITAAGLRNEIWHTAATEKLDLNSVLTGRDIEEMSNEELKEALTALRKMVPALETADLRRELYLKLADSGNHDRMKQILKGRSVEDLTSEELRSAVSTFSEPTSERK